VLTLPEGEHTITIKAISPQGEIQTLPLQITVDLTPPDIKLDDAPAATREPKLSLSGSISEPATLTFATNPIPLDAKRFTIPVDLQEGENIFNLAATDPASNTTTKTIRILLDTIPPEITRATCSAPETKGGEIIACEINAQDRGIGLAKTGNFTLSVAPGGREVKGILTFNRTKAIFEGSVFIPPGIKGKVTIKELRIQDRLGNETTSF
jgi:hypothetical protein